MKLVQQLPFRFTICRPVPLHMSTALVVAYQRIAQNEAQGYMDHYIHCLTKNKEQQSLVPRFHNALLVFQEIEPFNMNVCHAENDAAIDLNLLVQHNHGLQTACPYRASFSLLQWW